MLEKAIPTQEETKYPVCTAGAMNCPREDSGGIDGFYEKLEIIQNKQHPEYAETITWLGKKYDPFFFDIGQTNKQLAKVPTLLNEMFD